jgi:hypothetical protein
MLSQCDAPPSSLMDPTVSPKMKTTKGEGIGACSLTHNTSGVEGRVGALRWGLGRLTSKSITHTDLHKPNNKLINVELEHLWCRDEPHANTDSQNSPWFGLGGSHHLPRYCRTPTLAKCGGEAQHLEKSGVGVLRDSRMFRAWQQGPKHLALGWSWCHWKGLEV